MHISSGKEETDNPQYYVALEIGKISPLDTSYQIPINSKILGKHIFDTV